jgi:hypothetical protein
MIEEHDTVLIFERSVAEEVLALLEDAALNEQQPKLPAHWCALIRLYSTGRIRTVPARGRERCKAFGLLPARKTNSSWDRLMTFKRAPGVKP